MDVNRDGLVEDLTPIVNDGERNLDLEVVDVVAIVLVLDVAEASLLEIERLLLSIVKTHVLDQRLVLRYCIVVAR